MKPRATIAQRESFALALAEGDPIADAAARAGLSKEWGYLHRADADILARVRELQDPVADEVMRIFRGRAVRAARRITECIEPGDQLGNAASVNLEAAKLTLGFVGMHHTPQAAASAAAAVTVKVYTDPRMENPIEANWDDAPPPRSSADA
jgi:hypothetical protein